MEKEAYDVVIVGGGAAGLSAALVLGRARRQVVVIDAGAPRNAPASQMHGFLSRDGMPPAVLLAAGRAELTGYGVEFLTDEVLRIDNGFSVELAGGQVLSARRVLVATGARDELPDIPVPASAGAATSSTARTAMAGRFAISRWASSAPAPARRPRAPPSAVVGRRRLLRARGPRQRERPRRPNARGIAVVDGLVARLWSSTIAGRRELANGRAIPRAAVFIRPHSTRTTTT